MEYVCTDSGNSQHPNPSYVSHCGDKFGSCIPYTLHFTPRWSMFVPLCPKLSAGTPLGGEFLKNFQNLAEC
eukprot:scaffold44163_cov65-Cyclotella_meneghiniana.AAC.7